MAYSWVLSSYSPISRNPPGAGKAGPPQKGQIAPLAASSACNDRSAVAAFLSPRPSFRQAVLAGVKFGLGHSVTLLVLGSLILGARLTLTGAFQHIANLAGGALMIVIGASLLLRLFLHGYGHHHLHGHRAPGHGITLASAVLALGGVRSYLVVLPLALEGNITMSVFGMASFGAGVTAAMSLYGLVASSLIRGAGRVGPSIMIAVGAFNEHRCRVDHGRRQTQ